MWSRLSLTCIYHGMQLSGLSRSVLQIVDPLTLQHPTTTPFVLCCRLQPRQTASLPSTLSSSATWRTVRHKVMGETHRAS